MKNFQNIRDNTTLPIQKKNEMWVNIADKISAFEKSLPENVRMDGDKRHTQWDAYIKPSLLSPKKKYMNNAKIFATMILIMWAIMATASYAAEQALPGDALYGFKVHVNESVRGAFSFSAENKAKWEIEKIERRAEEKRELEAESHMTVEANAEIESRSQDSAEKVREVIVRLQTEWKAEAATSLEGGLNTALKAIITAQARHDEKSENEDHSDEIKDKTSVDADIDLDDSNENEMKWSVQGEIHSETKSENRATERSSLKSDLDMEGGLNLSRETD